MRCSRVWKCKLLMNEVGKPSLRCIFLKFRKNICFITYRLQVYEWRYKVLILINLHIYFTNNWNELCEFSLLSVAIGRHCFWLWHRQAIECLRQHLRQSERTRASLGNLFVRYERPIVETLVWYRERPCNRVNPVCSPAPTMAHHPNARCISFCLKSNENSESINSLARGSQSEITIYRKLLSIRPCVLCRVNRWHRWLHAIPDSICPTVTAIPVVRPNPRNSIECPGYQFGRCSVQPLSWCTSDSFLCNFCTILFWPPPNTSANANESFSCDRRNWVQTFFALTVLPASSRPSISTQYSSFCTRYL